MSEMSLVRATIIKCLILVMNVEEFAELGDSYKKPHVAFDVTSTAINASKYSI